MSQLSKFFELVRREQEMGWAQIEYRNEHGQVTKIVQYGDVPNTEPEPTGYNEEILDGKTGQPTGSVEPWEYGE